MLKELTSDGKYIFINSAYAEAYIPEDLFKSGDDEPGASTIAYDMGNELSLIGIFYMRFFDTDDITEDLRKKTPLRTLNYPNMIEARPSKKSSMTMNLDGETEKYRILGFAKGDILMDAQSKKSPDNVQRFTKLIMNGNIPRSLGYEEIYFAWKRCFEINGVNAKIPPVLMQAIIAKMCRSKSNPQKQFRETISANGKVDQHGYKMISMNQASAYSSAMSSMAFERFAEKLTTSLIMTKEGAEQEKSPIDKIITI